MQSLAKKGKGLVDMDTTTIGIIAGLVCTSIYVGALLYYKKSFDLPHTILVFLAAFSVPGGIGLIIAGYYGSPEDLPSSWREHVVVAGIVAIGLASQYVVTRIIGCAKKASSTVIVDAKSSEK